MISSDEINSSGGNTGGGGNKRGNALSSSGTSAAPRRPDSKRKDSKWEILTSLEAGASYPIRPRRFEGYLAKRRKWPMKGWHKRYFILDGGILTYYKNAEDPGRGREYHGRIDVGLAVISAKTELFRIDIDHNECIHHLKAGEAVTFGLWLEQLQQHRLYQQNLLNAANAVDGTLVGGAGGSSTLMSPHVESRESPSRSLDSHLASNQHQAVNLASAVGSPRGSLPRGLIGLPSALNSGGARSVYQEFVSMDERMTEQLVDLQQQAVALGLFAQRLEDEQMLLPSAANAATVSGKKIFFGLRKKKTDGHQHHHHRSTLPVVASSSSADIGSASNNNGMGSNRASSSLERTVSECGSPSSFLQSGQMQPPAPPPLALTSVPSSTESAWASECSEGAGATLRDEVMSLSQDLQSDIRNFLRNFTSERDRIKGLLLQLQQQEVYSSGRTAPGVAPLRQALAQAVQQNALLRARLQKIHLESDPSDLTQVNIPWGTESLMRGAVAPSVAAAAAAVAASTGGATSILAGVSNVASTLLNQSMSYSSSCLSEEAFFDAQEYEPGTARGDRDDATSTTSSSSDSEYSSSDSEDATGALDRIPVKDQSQPAKTSAKSDKSRQRNDRRRPSSATDAEEFQEANLPQSTSFDKDRTAVASAAGGSFGLDAAAMVSAAAVKSASMKRSLTGRRTALPCPLTNTAGTSLWNLLCKNIGKDLSKISMPVTLNEPLSVLQRLCEELEYSELLDRAVEASDAVDRFMLVAAFAVSAYGSCSARAGHKPFNPLLGETYECVREDRGFKYVAEQVSHHPPVSACHASSKHWTWWQDFRVKTKFWGKSMEFQPEGSVSLKLNLPDSNWTEVYSWNKITTCIHNLFSSADRWVDLYGECKISCQRFQKGSPLSGAPDQQQQQHLLSCKISFRSASGYWVNANRHEVQGAIYDAKGKVVRNIFGKCTEALYCGEAPSVKCIWRPGTLPDDAALYYGFSRFAMELNETLECERPLLPHTDARFRPDQRCLEEGQIADAEALKLKLEQAQRDRRRMAEEQGLPYKPLWFGHSSGWSIEDEDGEDDDFATAAAPGDRRSAKKTLVKKRLSRKQLSAESSLSSPGCDDNSDSSQQQWVFGGRYWKVRANPGFENYFGNTEVELTPLW